MSKHLKWIEGSLEKFEVGMLVVIGGEQFLIGDLGRYAGFGCSDEYELKEVQKWTYLIRDYEFQWHFEMMKGKK